MNDLICLCIAVSGLAMVLALLELYDWDIEKLFFEEEEK